MIVLTGGETVGGAKPPEIAFFKTFISRSWKETGIVYFGISIWNTIGLGDQNILETPKMGLQKELGFLFELKISVFF